jgi:hypothetical protein
VSMCVHGLLLVILHYQPPFCFISRGIQVSTVTG